MSVSFASPTKGKLSSMHLWLHSVLALDLPQVWSPIGHVGSVHQAVGSSSSHATKLHIQLHCLRLRNPTLHSYRSHQMKFPSVRLLLLLVGLRHHQHKVLITTEKPYILDTNSHEFHIFWAIIVPNMPK